MSDDDSASRVEKGSPKASRRRTQTVSTKLTPEEEDELLRASRAEGKKMAEWVRDVLVGNARQNFPFGSHQPIVLTELVGIQLFLMNVLSPLTRGELISPEQYETIIRGVQANKGRATRELLDRRRNQEKD